MKMISESTRIKSPIPFILLFGTIGTISFYMFLDYKEDNEALSERLQEQLLKTAAAEQKEKNTKVILDEKIEKIQSLQMDIVRLTEQINENGLQIGNLKGEIETCNKEKNQGNGFYNTVKEILGKVEELREVEKDLPKAHEILNNEIKTIKENSEKVKKLEEEKKTLEEQQKILEEEKKSNQSKYDEATKKIKELTEKLSAVENLIAKNTKKNEEENKEKPAEEKEKKEEENKDKPAEEKEKKEGENKDKPAEEKEKKEDEKKEEKKTEAPK